MVSCTIVAFVWLSLMPVMGTITVTGIEAVKLFPEESVAVAVMVDVPALTPVTVAVFSSESLTATVALAGVEEVQVTLARFVAPVGVRFRVRSAVAPT